VEVGGVGFVAGGVDEGGEGEMAQNFIAYLAGQSQKRDGLRHDYETWVVDLGLDMKDWRSVVGIGRC
jgi:hypothetical protein